MLSDWPTLSLVIPVGPGDDANLQALLTSLQTQDYPQEQVEVLLIREGNSEEAKAIGIQQAHGDIIGMLCTDNVLTTPTFLTQMVDAAHQPSVVGAYTSHYAYIKKDTPLNRYFALLGANDPLCWWLGKADRRDYLSGPPKSEGASYRLSHRDSIPSCGDNGFFLKATLAKSVLGQPDTFGSCMDMCEDLRRHGYAIYTIVPTTLWHRTGLSWRRYFVKRWRYVRELYWRRLPTRRWRMVSTPHDWWRCITFALASFTVVFHLWVSIKGYRRVRDWSWFLHSPVCLLLTLLYTAAWLEALMRRLSSRRGTDRRAMPHSGGA